MRYFRLFAGNVTRCNVPHGILNCPAEGTGRYAAAAFASGTADNSVRILFAEVASADPSRAVAVEVDDFGNVRWWRADPASLAVAA